MLKMKKTLLLPHVFVLLNLAFYPGQVFAADTSSHVSVPAKHTKSVAEQNKKIVTDFYEGVFLKHQVKQYADRYIGNQYIQHNPNVPDGKAPFVNFFTQKFSHNPQAKNVIKKVIAEGDLVVLHVHSTENDTDRGRAIIDIFRVEHGKIVEHWDVIQNIPENSKNANTMF
ncbi:ester cyclase [Acinetobacter courvalinii]|jgi:predicted SnoaL-like aldol condensation-catalyzing enzyme|uniref:nuclear transport factor 2 family protein n=1 Tax=Acinetobacter TaxID=469 RepID=UPI0021CDA3BA|nr:MULTISPECIES: ester cyclase [Acinetobacter]MCU4392614.1 ester cyclase [Acinetobacter courvalinii]MDR2060544.1 ester cyclase [Acinetobacter sp.]